MVVSADGTEIRIVSGRMAASAEGCRHLGLPELPEVKHELGYDDLERCAALGQSCGCSRGDYWERCAHGASATLAFLAVGSKLRDACRRCGTDAAGLLVGQWHWRDALQHVRGLSPERPSLQLRRSLFAHRARATLVHAATEPRGDALTLEAPDGADPGGDVYAVPGLDNVCIRASLTQELREPQLVAAAACSAVSPELYAKVAQLSPSQLKSLMQKIVRWGKTVQCTTESMDAILVCSFVALVCGPGQYRQDLKVNMRGPRLALQRAVTIMVEDGLDAQDFGESLLYFACLAAVTQEECARPSAPTVVAAARMLVRAAHADSVLAWREKDAEGAAHWVAAGVRSVFKHIKAMPGDLRMFEAVRGARFRTQPPPDSHRPAVRASLLKVLSAHLDQHSEKNFAHSVASLDWWTTTGANYREGRPVDASKLLQMEQPQLVALAHTAPGLLRRPELAQTGSALVPLACELEELAAYCAGEIAVGPYLAVFSPHDLQSISIMEKPTRTQEDIAYIGEDSARYKEAQEALRRKRVRLARPMEGYLLVFVDGAWTVLEDKAAAPAPEVLTGHVRVPLHAAAQRAHMGLLQVGQGLRAGGLGSVVGRFRQLREADMKEVMRTLSVVDAANDVHMAPLERAVNVVGARHGVYCFLAHVAFQAPGAMRLTRAATFRVHDAILFAHVRSLLAAAMNEHRTPLGQFRAATAVADDATPHARGQSTFERLLRHHPRAAEHIAAFLPRSLEESGLGCLRAETRGPLREGQARCLQALTLSGSRGFVLAPTGSGKTAVAVNRMSEMAEEVVYGVFFIDTGHGASSVALEIESRCLCDIVFLDPRTSHKPGAKEMASGKLTGRYVNRTAAPVPRRINLVLYDHFAQYPEFRSAILDVASQSFAVFDEVDKLYAASARSLYAVPFARLFKHLLMMSATALRKHSEEVGPRAAIASLFAPVPVTKSSLLVFFAGSVQSFSHELAYETEHSVLRFAARLPVEKSSSFHDLSERAFEASVDKLLEAARAHPPCIIACESAAQVGSLLRRAPEECQGYPRSEDEPLQKPIVVISKNQGRSTNFGRVCNSLVSLPLASSVATRRQIAGRLTRGPIRKLHYTTVIPEDSVLDLLFRQQTSSNNLQIKLENLVALANSLQEKKRRA